MKERKRRSVLQSARADGDGMRRPPGHLITRAGREEVMRKGGGEEVRSVRCMCDVCAAHGDRAAVGVDVDAQGSSLREDESHFPLKVGPKPSSVGYPVQIPVLGFCGTEK